METIGDYINRMIEEGYIGEKGQPLKCFKCGGEDFEETNHCMGNYSIDEYDMVCSCGTIVGHWAYGYWDV